MLGSCKRILIVDNDIEIRHLLRHLLDEEYCLAEASTGEEAIAMLAGFVPDLVMLDIMMPGIDGHETCRRIRSNPSSRGIQVVMLSARSSREEQLRAYAAGADDYIVKPFDPHELRSRLRLHFRLRAALDTIALTGGGAGLSVAAAAHAPGRTGRSMAHLYDTTVAALTSVAQLRDTETGEHLVRMRSYTQIVAEELGRDGPYADQIDEQFLEDIFRASPLHDIGKVGISDAILLKPARLTQDEFETMKRHATIGANILDHVAYGAPGVSFLSMAAVIARFHHERFDGGGYPVGLGGTDIPLPARIVAIADAFDAITSIRPYKAPQSATIARRRIQGDSGSHFDPAVVEAFLRRFDALARHSEPHSRPYAGRNWGRFITSRAIGSRKLLAVTPGTSPSAQAASGGPNMLERIREGLPTCRQFAAAVLGMAVLVGCCALSQYNYLLFHSLVEVFSAVVACAVFMLFWNTRRFANNGFFLFIGIACLFTGLFDLLHALTFRGMSVFPGDMVDQSLQLKTAGRWMASVSFLIAPLVIFAAGSTRVSRRGFMPSSSRSCFTASSGICSPTATFPGRGLPTFSKSAGR